MSGGTSTVSTAGEPSPPTWAPLSPSFVADPLTMPPPSFDGVLAQTPPSYGPQLTVWSPWAPSYRVALGTSGFSSMMTPQPGTSAASSIEILSPFHLPGPGLLGSSLSEAPEPIQAYMSPYAPVLATSLGPMTSRYSCGQSHFPGRQPPPLLKTKSRKNSGAKNKSTKGEKGGSSDAGREHVAAARKPWLTVPSRHEVQDGIPKGLEVSYPPLGLVRIAPSCHQGCSVNLL